MTHAKKILKNDQIYPISKTQSSALNKSNSLKSSPSSHQKTNINIASNYKTENHNNDD